MNEGIDFLLSVWHDEVTLYQGYFALFIVCIIYLYCLKRKTMFVKGIVCFSIVVILLFCFLPFVWFYQYFFADSEEYFHLLWLLPVLPVFGFVFEEYWEKLKRPIGKAAWVLFCIFYLGMAGYCAYFPAEWSQQGFSSWNPYLEEQIEICTILDAMEGDKFAVVYKDFLPLVRQVSGQIKLLYGDDIETGVYNTEVEMIYEMMQEVEIDMELLLEKVKKQGVHYMILPPHWHTLSKSLSELQEERKLSIVYEMEHYSLIKF